MNHIAFDPNGLTGEQCDWWTQWLERAKTAALAASEQVQRGEKVQFFAKVWSELKGWLLKNVFHGKCAYCESRVTVTDYGDADHYRPKGSVADVPGHSGYFWVTYDWLNLVPSCKQCNTGGKGDTFPVSGRRVFRSDEAATPAMLDSIEKPLLLHPYGCGENNPRKHLVFNKLGHVKARNRSVRGRFSISVYKLRRWDLKDERRECLDHALLKF